MIPRVYQQSSFTQKSRMEILKNANNIKIINTLRIYFVTLLTLRGIKCQFYYTLLTIKINIYFYLHLLSC